MHEEIQQIMFWLSKDNSYSDDKDKQYNSANAPPMKTPYLISGYEADAAGENKLFPKLFALGDNVNIEEPQNGLDLLSLKQVVRDSYLLCNFSSQEIMQEAA